MLKLERNHKCESYFRNNDLYDSKREKEYKVAIFGLTIYKVVDSYKCDVKNINGKNVGFNKDETA